MLKRFFHDESGQTAIEYGLIAAMLAAAMIVAFQVLGVEYVSMFTKVETEVTNA